MRKTAGRTLSEAEEIARRIVELKKLQGEADDRPARDLLERKIHSARVARRLALKRAQLTLFPLKKLGED